MDLGLKDKRVFVTGSSSGIGIEIAKLFAQEGSVVVVHGRNRARTESTARAVEEGGGRAVVAIGDIATDEGAEAAASAANEALGGIDILVDNASEGGGKNAPKWTEISIQDYIDAHNINLVAGLRLVHRFAPGMVERGWGRIINISSAVGRQSMGAFHHYAAAKVAMESLSLNLSQNLAKHGVTVNVVTPGLMLTDGARQYVDNMRAAHGWPDAEKEARYITEFAPQAVHRLGRPVEIAYAVAFLASPLSDYTTNAVLRVDGGMSRYL